MYLFARVTLFNFLYLTESEAGESNMGFFKPLNIMMQRTANENAACLRRICKRSDEPKIEKLLSLVTRFACDIGQLARIWIRVSSEVITICI